MEPPRDQNEAEMPLERRRRHWHCALVAIRIVKPYAYRRLPSGCTAVRVPRKAVYTVEPYRSLWCVEASKRKHIRLSIPSCIESKYKI
eukprot:6681618-Prymnesium_polylepis.1